MMAPVYVAATSLGSCYTSCQSKGYEVYLFGPAWATSYCACVSGPGSIVTSGSFSTFAAQAGRVGPGCVDHPGPSAHLCPSITPPSPPPSPPRPSSPPPPPSTPPLPPPSPTPSPPAHSHLPSPLFHLPHHPCSHRLSHLHPPSSTSPHPPFSTALSPSISSPLPYPSVPLPYVKTWPDSLR